MPAMRRWAWMGLAWMLLGGCAAHAPVEEMAAARSAVESVRAMPGTSPLAEKRLQSAEQALAEAARAMEAGDYAKARSKARQAQREAARAAELKREAMRKKQRKQGNRGGK